MPRKTKPYVPPFLHLYMQAEGDTLLTMTVQKPVQLTARTFEAIIKTHPSARKTALAITLLEVARALLPELGHESTHLKHIISSLVIDETPMQDFSIPDDWPF